MNLIELSLCHRGDALKLPAELAPEDLLGILVPERPDHSSQNTPATRLTQYGRLAGSRGLAESPEGESIQRKSTLARLVLQQ